MADKKHITCTVEYSEGAIDRITDVLVDYYYAVQAGIYVGLMQKKNDLQKEESTQNNK